MSKSLKALLAADISDPTDFPAPSDAPGLRPLDLALRCTICGEFFDAPVTLACGHGFCSLCVRDAFREKAECPSCRAPATESHLRKNVAMEEAVIAWKSARILILRLSLEYVEAKSKPRSKFDALNGESPRKKRKRSDERPEGLSRADNLPGPSRAQKSNPAHSTNAQFSSAKIYGEIEEEGEEDETSDHIPTSDVDEEEMQDDSIIDCPVCGKKIRLCKINNHLDKGCPPPSPMEDANGMPFASKKAKNKQDWTKLFKAGHGSSTKEKESSKSHVREDEPDRLPKASYAVLKDKTLREMLQEHKLSTTGDRSTWIARHQRYVMLYNANLDKSSHQRRTGHELRSDLQRWEDSRGLKRTVIKDIDAYEKDNKANFDRLVDAVRKNGRKTKLSDKENCPSSSSRDSPDGEDGGAVSPAAPAISSSTHVKALDGQGVDHGRDDDHDVIIVPDSQES